jgi:hypothetical protein
LGGVQHHSIVYVSSSCTTPLKQNSPRDCLPIVAGGCRSNAKNTCPEVEPPKTWVLQPMDPLEFWCLCNGNINGRRLGVLSVLHLVEQYPIDCWIAGVIDLRFSLVKRENAPLRRGISAGNVRVLKQFHGESYSSTLVPQKG